MTFFCVCCLHFLGGRYLLAVAFGTAVKNSFVVEMRSDMLRLRSMDEGRTMFRAVPE